MRIMMIFWLKFLMVSVYFCSLKIRTQNSLQS